MYQLRDVTKVYTRRGSEVVALRAEKLEIPVGGYTAIIGPSGSGKTTLLSTLGGMLSPTTGKVSINGTSLYDLSAAERARLRLDKIGFVFQTFNLVPYLTAVENVQVPLCLSGHTKGDQTNRAVALLNRVGLSERMNHKPRELSIGQQQRVALARTLANDPSVILADEPTGNLDAESRRVVLDFLDELHKGGCTIVMVTHDTVAAERASARLYLKDGAVLSSPAGSAIAA